MIIYTILFPEFFFICINFSCTGPILAWCFRFIAPILSDNKQSTIKPCEPENQESEVEPKVPEAQSLNPLDTNSLLKELPILEPIG